MDNPAEALRVAYEEAYQAGVALLERLRLPLSDESLEQIAELVGQRDARIEAAGALAARTPQTTDSLRTLRGLLDQQRAVEAEMAKVLGQLRQTWESNGSYRTKVDGARRVLGYQGASRQLDSKR